MEYSVCICGFDELDTVLYREPSRDTYTSAGRALGTTCYRTADQVPGFLTQWSRAGPESAVYGCFRK